MTESAPDTAVPSTQATSSAASADTSSLQMRPPLSARAGAPGARRLKREAALRGRGIGKDETDTAGFFFTLCIRAIRWILVALGVYRRGLRNARALCLVDREIVMADLPEGLDGFRILHISDCHFPKRYPAFSEAIGALLNGVQVDLCALTGDFRYGYFGPADHVADHLRVALRGVTSRLGVFSVLGNHDRFVTGELLDESGFPILYNEGVALEANSAVVWVCGVDEPHFYKCDDLAAALYGRPENAFTILLIHSPERVEEAARNGVSLYLAGHTHGGQIRFPLLGALVSNARCARDQIWGVWRHGKMAGHTTAGIGATDIPARFNCPPEAVIITLRRKASGE